MATAPPTPSTLRSWEDAFNHPLPVVRKLESQLRNDISEKQNKLRSLVGASYRDLLGTAERIIEMDGQMELVESNLADIGRRCNYRAVERGRGNLGGLKKAGEHEKYGKLEVMAKVKVLKGALDAVGRMIRKGGNALGAAKVLVLARLLHKNVSEYENVPAVLAELRKKLAGVRKRLLSYIERALAKTASDRTVLSNTLCAYAMITSSAPKEVLKHFLQVRYEQLESKAESPQEHNILAMLELYGRTLTDTRDLFPRRLADALAQLSKDPLLQDEQVMAVQELNLDIYRQWIPEDIQRFTPWVREDQLTSANTNEGLKAWAKQAQTSFMQALEACLQAQQNAELVLSTRKSVLSSFLKVSSKAKNDSFTEMTDDLRRPFVTRLRELASRSADLSQFALQSLDNPAKLSKSTVQTSPWSLATQSLDMSAGALSFRTAILDHRHGRNEPIKREHQELDRWTAQLSSHWDFVAAMRAAKWDDDLDFDLEDLDYEGDNSLQDALNRKDAGQVERELREATTKALKSAYEKVETVASAETRHAAFFIRLLRELDQRRRGLGDRLVPSNDAKVFDHTALISTMHSNLAAQAVQQPLAEYVAANGKRTLVPTILWDGTPALPTQPSPSAFRLLTALQARLVEVGEDVWTPGAVAVVKEHLSKGLADTLNKMPESKASDADKTEDEEADAADSNNNDSTFRTQCAFDASYFASALALPQQQSQLDDLVAALSKAAGLDGAGRQRMAKSASEYWKRTSLLFGLLN